MRRQDKEQDRSPYLFCEQCKQMFERAFVQECSYCFKEFCRDCAVRSGNTAFCSKACAKGWFFTDVDESETEDEDEEEDKGDL